MIFEAVRLSGKPRAGFEWDSYGEVIGTVFANQNSGKRL
jgi:hypothetical protein